MQTDPTTSQSTRKELQSKDCLLEDTHSGQRWPGPRIAAELSLAGGLSERDGQKLEALS